MALYLAILSLFLITPLIADNSDDITKKSRPDISSSIYDNYAVPSIQINNVSDEDANLLQNINKTIKEKITEIQKLKQTLAKTSTIKEKERISVLIRALQNDIQSSLRSWKDISGQPNSSYVQHMVPISMSLADVVDIFIKEKIIIFHGKSPKNCSISLQSFLDIPESMQRTVLNNILQATGFTISHEDEFSVSITELLGRRSVDNVINIEDSIAHIPDGSQVLGLCCDTNISKSFRELLKSQFGIYSSSNDDFVIPFIVSKRDLISIKQAFEILRSNKKKIEFRKIKCITYSPTQLVSLLNTWKTNKSVPNPELIQFIANDAMGYILVSGTTLQLEVVEKTILDLNEKEASSLKDTSIIKWRPRQLSFSAISGMIQNTFGISKNNIINNETSGDIVIISPQSIEQDIRYVLKEQDPLPKTISIDCILIETSKVNTDSSNLSVPQINIKSIALFALNSLSVRNYSPLNIAGALSDIAYASLKIMKTQKPNDEFLQYGKICCTRNTKIQTIQKLVLTDQKEGKIKLCTEISVASGEALRHPKDKKNKINGSSYSRQEYGLILEITPKIIDSDKVSLKISSKLDTLEKTSEKPEVKRRSIDIQDVISKNDRMIIIGKIDKTEEQEIEDNPYSILTPIFKMLGYCQETSKHSNDTTLTVALISHIC
ncbi:MAG: hypothetical protein KAH32_02480 [Chlamydiia bacterium]|nr:hypothetical protein [Chlamydiia bacterium]